MHNSVYLSAADCHFDKLSGQMNWKSPLPCLHCCMISPCCADILRKHIDHNRSAGQPDLPVTAPALSCLEHRIASFLSRIGIPAHTKGFLYTRKAIFLTLKDSEATGMMAKDLYPSVAEAYDTTPSQVERAICHAVELIRGRCDSEALQNIFGCVPGGDGPKLENSEFIARIASHLRTQPAEE